MMGYDDHGVSAVYRRVISFHTNIDGLWTEGVVGSPVTTTEYVWGLTWRNQRDLSFGWEDPSRPCLVVC